MLTNNNNEAVSLISTFISQDSLPDNQTTPSTQGVLDLALDKDRYVTLDNKEEWDKFFRLQNDPSTNSTNTRTPRPYIHKNSNGEYKYTAEDENKYNGKEIIGKVAEQIKEEICKKAGTGDISFIKLKENKNDNNNVEPAIRFTLNGNLNKINMKDLVDGDVCKEYDVKVITFCLPNKTRGLRCRIDNDRKRIYEVANGSYEMTLKWCVEGKECNVKINIHDNGSVEFIESNGVTKERLEAHKEVKVGRQYSAKFLHEALASQLQQVQPESAETGKILPQPATNVTDTNTEQHQGPAAAQAK